MRPQSRTLSIARPMTRIVYLTAAAAFSLGLAAAAWMTGREQTLLQLDAARESASLLAATLSGDGSEPAARLERMVDHPRTLAAALWREGDDRPVHLSARNDQARLLLDRSRSDVSNLPGPATAGLDWVTVTAPCRQSSGAATLGLVLMQPPDESSGLSVPLVIGLGSLAVIPALLANFYLRSRFIHPIRWLAQGLADDPRRPLHKALLRRDDEIGSLTAELARRRRKARYWRKRCTQWTRDHDARISRETHEIRTQLHRTQREAERDALTGILNRRQLERRLDALFDAQRFSGQDLSIVMLDVDHFKHLNDTLGHAAGDALLAFAGELIRSHIRAGDLAVRYGGDEFTLVLPGMSEERAGLLAGRLTSLFAQRARAMGVNPAPTLSAGVAGLLARRAKSPSELLAQADRALYDVKRHSRRPVRGNGAPAVAARHDQPVKT